MNSSLCCLIILEVIPTTEIFSINKIQTLKENGFPFSRIHQLSLVSEEWRLRIASHFCARMLTDLTLCL